MSALSVGDVLHHLKAVDYDCAQVEAVGRDWAVCRTKRGGLVLVRLREEPDREHSSAWADDCPFATDDGGEQW